MPPASLTRFQYASWATTMSLTRAANGPDRSASRPMRMVVSSAPKSVLICSGADSSVCVAGSVPAADSSSSSPPQATPVDATTTSATAARPQRVSATVRIVTTP